jgi:serine protease Do
MKQNRPICIALAVAALAALELAAGVPKELLEAQKKTIAVAPKVIAATVGFGPGDGKTIQNGQGTAVIVSKDGLMLTAGHTITNGRRSYTVILADGRRARAVPLGYNRFADAGMMKITDPGPWPFVPIGKSTDLELGDWVLGVGHSDGVFRDRPAPLRLGRLHGNISKEKSEVGLLTGVTIQPGDSGGALVDLDGKLIGIHSSCGSTVNDNIHVPIETFLRDWDDLKAGKAIGTKSGRRRGLIWEQNAMVTEVGGHMMTHSKVLSRFNDAGAKAAESVVGIWTKAQSGERRGHEVQLALATAVDEQHAVSKHSELRGHGNIWTFDGRVRTRARVVAYDEASDLALLRVSGVKLKPIKWSKTRDVNVGTWLVSPRTDGSTHALGVVGVEAQTIPWLPARIEAVDRRAALGVVLKRARQATIGAVLNNSAADKAGLQPNDTIVTVAGKPVANGDALVQQIAKYDPGDEIVLEYVRGQSRRQCKARLLADKDMRWPNPSREHMPAYTGAVNKRAIGFPSAILHDSPIAVNNCGGPVVTPDGRAVGLNIARSDRTMSYAIPAEAVQAAVKRMLKR